MELLTRRISSGAESTLGVCHDVSGDAPVFLCYMLEDQHNEPKIPGETRIPAGRYQIKYRNEGGLYGKYTHRFSWHRGMLWLQDVPDFDWVYIHVGNDDDDTEGCPVVGDGQIQNVTERGMVTSSVAAYRRFYDIVAGALDRGEPVWIEFEDYA